MRIQAVTLPMLLSARDEFLIGRLKKGDSGALDEMVERFASAIDGYLQIQGIHSPKKLRTVFLKVFYRPAFDVPILLQLLRQVYLEKKSLTAEERAGTLSLGGSFPLLDQGTRVILEKFAACLKELNEEERDVLLLRDQQLLTFEEIAWILHKPENELKSPLNQGRLKIRKILGNQLSKLTHGL